MINALTCSDVYASIDDELVQGNMATMIKQQQITRHEENNLGLPYPVILMNSAVKHWDGNGVMLGVSVPNLEGLAVAVAIERLHLQVAFTGSEVRFLRKILDISPGSFASAMDLDLDQLVQWETGQKSPGTCADKLARIAAVASLIPDSKLLINTIFRWPATMQDEQVATVAQHFGEKVVFHHMADGHWFCSLS